MYTNSEMLQAILEEKGLSVYDVCLQLGHSGRVYEHFKKNRFNKHIITKLEEMTGEDLSMFINC